MMMSGGDLPLTSRDLAMPVDAKSPTDLASSDLATGAAADLTKAPADLSVTSPYPSGPYGVNVGDTVANLSFPGYFNPTNTTALASAVPYGTVTLDMARRSGQRYAVLMLYGYW